MKFPKGFFKKLNIALKSKSCKDRYRKAQNTFCFCTRCNNELISSHSFVSDGECVTYKCTKCGEVSKWNFDSPTPVLLKD